jgi:hypothetical protein
MPMKSSENHSDKHSYPNQKNRRRCIVNYVTLDSKYRNGQMRLKNAFRTIFNPQMFYGYDRFFFVEGELPSVPSHNENPYAFKVFAIEHCKKLGYEQILWLDASMVPVQNLDPLWAHIDEVGYFMEHSGHALGSWCNDHTLLASGLTREEAMKIPMFSAGFLGLDFTNDKARNFFDLWTFMMEQGLFKGSWSDHRHDMSCGSIIAHNLAMTNWTEAGKFFAYIGPGYAPLKETAIFHLLGL